MADVGKQQLWSKLPDEVMQSIFNRLNVFDIVRVGCTCTRLRAFISSHRLIPSSAVSLLALVDPFNIPALDLEHLETAAWVYDCSRDAWPQLSLAFLEPHLPGSPNPVASAGGLICFGAASDFIVFNPITRSCRRLPDRPLHVDADNGQSFELDYDEDAMEAFGMAYDSTSGTYEFFILHHSVLQSEKESRMMLYSSSPSQWRVLPPLVAGEASELHSNTITSSNSGLYVLMMEGDSIEVFAYRSGAWSKIESPECTSRLLQAFLLDVHGELHMVGGVGSVWLHDDVWERPTSVRIWKLDEKSMEWTEVMRMPTSVLQEFRRHIDFDFLEFCGNDGVVYMKSSASDVLVCDLSRGEWKWLKGLDLSFNIMGLIFEPSLSASP